MVAVAEAPDGTHRARIEGNLTALLYGPECAVGCLTPEDLVPALDRFHATAVALLGDRIPAPSEWPLHRLDPSVTVVSEDPACEVIDAAVKAWRVSRSGRQVVSQHNTETATLRLTKWRSWSVYDKRTEALAKKNPLVAANGPTLLRLEARLRPRRAESEQFRSFRPTLALTSHDQEVIVSELDMLQQSLQKVAATGVMLAVRSLIRQGVSPNTAMRLASVMQLVAAYGDAALDELGVPESTVRRWKAEARKYSSETQMIDDVIDDLPTVARSMMRLTASELASKKKKGEQV